MNHYFPVYTEKAECQDCYKCVRACPTKAIHVENGSASVIQEMCILCGKCVQVCPVGAKRIRSDIERVKRLLAMKEKVFVSLAPSFISEFNDVSPEQLIHSLKSLGFHGVSETALGAQEVSAHVTEIVEASKKKINISSACPTIVQLIKKYYPEFTSDITQLDSPVLAHTKLLRLHYGDEIGVVFIGPCISKKIESDDNPNELDIAITFSGLRKWFEAEGINISEMKSTDSDNFIPVKAEEGGLYPVDGGMLSTIKANCKISDAHFMAASGIDEVKNILKGLENFNPQNPVFLELMACKGGCINGPCTSESNSTLINRFEVIENASYNEDDIPRKSQIDITRNISETPIKFSKISDDEIRTELNNIGKYSKADELNCGGCGYDSCREFAQAILEGKAERDMCVSYMRKMAHKKANALLKTMPSGVVIVNEDLKVVECNKNFIKIIGGDNEIVFDAKPGLEGASLKKLVPFHDYFKRVLDTGEDILDKEIHFNDNIIYCSIFSIEQNRIVGGVFQDITTPALRKAQVIKKTQKVIEKNLATVQKIAYLLGENASETEVMLDSIIRSFSIESIEDTK